MAALGARLRDEFPTTRFNFTQPIIDSVTEDTNGTRANLAVEFSGPNSDVLRELALSSEAVQRALEGRAVRTVIVRAPRLVNVVPA